MLDKWVIFLLKLKMGCKASETTCNINSAFGPGTTSKHTVQWWFKKFCKGDWEPWTWRVQWLATRNDSPTESNHWSDPLTTTWEAAEKLSINHSIIVQNLKQIGKIKEISKWVPHELTENFFKNVILKCHLLLFSAAMNHFSIGSWYMTKRGFYATTSSNDQLRQISSDWEEALTHFQSQMCTPQKIMVTVWGSAVSLIYYSFLNPRKTTTSEKYAQQIDEMHWKLQLALVKQKGVILLHDNTQPHLTQPMLQKLKVKYVISLIKLYVSI